MTNLELAGRLRALANLFEAHPEVQQPYDLQEDHHLSIYCHNKANAAAAIRAFGAGNKVDDDSTIKYLPTAFPGIEIHIFKADACKRIKVGERVIPETLVPARPAEDQRVIPEHTEEIYEWRCHSLLDSQGVEVPA